MHLKPRKPYCYIHTDVNHTTHDAHEVLCIPLNIKKKKIVLLSFATFEKDLSHILL